MSCTPDMDVASAERFSTGAPDVARPPCSACARQGFSQTINERRHDQQQPRGGAMPTIGKRWGLKHSSSDTATLAYLVVLPHSTS